jgi:flagellar biosynthesis protein FlhF
VREALGADAVVLSNRTLDDGSVEIVALADSDLAAVAPQAAARVRAAVPRMPESVPAAAVPGIVTRPGATFPRPVVNPAVNPYAAGDGGLPDVFSSVFGASADTIQTSEAAAFDAAHHAEAQSSAAAASSAGRRRRRRRPQRRPGTGRMARRACEAPHAAARSAQRPPAGRTGRARRAHACAP